MICPFCKEEIQDSALICKHCHSRIVMANGPSMTIQQLDTSQSSGFKYYNILGIILSAKSILFGIGSLCASVFTHVLSSDASEKFDDIVEMAIYAGVFSFVSLALSIVGLVFGKNTRWVAYIGLAVGSGSLIYAVRNTAMLVKLSHHTFKNV